MAISTIITFVTLAVCISLNVAAMRIPRSLTPPTDAAHLARYIMHISDWISLATISTQDSTKGYPFVSLKSVSDGPITNSTGVPYLYMTDMDISAHDLTVDDRATIMASLEQSDYCQSESYDPQDPRCAKVMISGKYIKVDNRSAEYEFAKESLFSRHPSMRHWPASHGFYIAKVDIVNIDVLGSFGGIKQVTKDDYFNANINPNETSTN